LDAEQAAWRAAIDEARARATALQKQLVRITKFLVVVVVVVVVDWCVRLG
jgi:hypothetical protein